MLFNSLEFAVFLPIVFFIYWILLKNHTKLQNFFIVLASYFFYGWWDYRFLYLIIFSSLADYFISHFIFSSDSHARRRAGLFLSIFLNLGLLFFFKYFNFFLDSLEDSFTLFGNTLEVDRLSIVLPVGISFYTFQTLSYTLDVYKGKLKPTNNIISFLAFVSFFPQLVAGPIERAKNLLPQFETKREFNRYETILGLRQILWGLVKKIIIADNCALYVSEIFSSPDQYNSSALIIGAVLFAFQIYGDFSGYSDIAIGTARMFGFSLMKNFAYPYFSRDIAEFWRRWHISLSTWFRDYLYIPLGGSQVNKLKKVRNILIIFIVSGFWHGANWTYIFWGLLNAIYFLPLAITEKNRKHLKITTDSGWIPNLSEFGKILFTFILTTIAWVFFRSPSVADAFTYLGNIASGNPFQFPNIEDLSSLIKVILWIIIVTIIEWFSRNHDFPLEKINGPKFIRWSLYSFVIIMLISYSGKPQDFIYFQF
jgi:alginate O-acetyltransferase complex protein AlgI